ncbi:MAG: damage-control phosphatase ARMT1 family protein [Candidatus Woesearchaeota archaeon]
MKIELDCLACIFRQTLEAGRMVTEDENLIREILNEYAKIIPDIDPDETAPEIVGKIQSIIKEKTHQTDPYHQYKNDNIQKALDYYPEIVKIIETAEDPLHAALIMAAVGNSMDAGVSLKTNLKNSIEQADLDGFIRSDYKNFKQKLDKNKSILFIADNAGEAVFDKLLLKELNKYKVNITYAVREEPVLNDVTRREAELIGIGEECNLISSGNKTPGLILKNSSEEFKKYYREADIRISKGQGNLEGLSEEKQEIYFLLKAKCELVAELLKVNVGDLVFVLNS